VVCSLVTTRGRRHHVHVDQLEAQAGDPLQEPVEGALIGQLGS
jgi:hypothetical protein